MIIQHYNLFAEFQDFKHCQDKVAQVRKLIYRKCVTSTRGYYHFHDSCDAGLNQERLLFKSGYYYEFWFFTFQNMLKIT